MHPEATRINDYVDGALDASERADIERHLASCTSCRQLVEDLDEIARAAATLEYREPSARAWSRIERAIRLEPDFGTRAQGFQPGVSTSSARLKGSRSVWIAGLAAAAALVLIAVGLRFSPLGSRPETSRTQADTGASIAAGATGAPADSFETELRQAEQHYEKAIKGLEQITNADQGALDAPTASTLQKNLAVIDQAIDESRAAVRSQPASEPAQQSLIESFRAKIGLLQDTVALINEMRKGNEAGAARIVSGLKAKGT